MNERIRELVGQAKFIAEETINKKISKNAELDAFAEKFAELIVRECIDVVEGGSFLHNQAPTAIFARECSSAIKQHFGVE